MTPRRRAVLGECEARTQGAFVAGGYGRNRGRRIVPSSAARGQGFVLTRSSLSRTCGRAGGDRAAQGLLPAGGAVGARARCRERPPARRRAHRAPPGAGQRAGRAAGVLAPALLRRALRDPDVPAARLRAGDALPAPPRGRRPRSAGAERGRRSRRQPRAAGAPAPARRRPPLLPGRVPARRASSPPARRAARGTRTSSCARRTPTRRASSPSSPRAEGFALAVYERSRHAVAYAKGTETIADFLAFLGAQDAALRLGEEAVVAATRARANRLANADHANIVRTSRAADAQLRAIRRLEREGRLDELAPELAEIARLRVRHPTLSLQRARPPLQPAGDEGGRPPPARARAAARGALGGWCERAGGEAPRTTSPSALHHAPDRGAGRGLYPTPDERRPAPGERNRRSERVQGPSTRNFHRAGRR